MIKEIMNYALRNAETKDKAWLEELRRETYKDLFQQTWGGWDEQRHQRHFTACWERGHIRIIEMSSSPVGMLQLFETGNQIEIGEIQISPAWQGRGLGAQILGDLVEHAQKASKDIVLSTGLKNAGALKLYTKLGFKESGRSETHVHMVYNYKANP